MHQVLHDATAAAAMGRIAEPSFRGGTLHDSVRRMDSAVLAVVSGELFTSERF